MRRGLRRWWLRLWHGGLHVRPEPLLTIETIEGRHIPRPKAFTRVRSAEGGGDTFGYRPAPVDREVAARALRLILGDKS